MRFGEVLEGTGRCREELGGAGRYSEVLGSGWSLRPAIVQ